MIDRQTIDLILSRADILDVVGDYVSLRQRGANWVGLCPFHNEKTPSFSVSPSRGIYKCFGCGKGGNALNFIMEVEHLSFVDAVRFLGKKVGVAVEEEQQTQEQIEALAEEARLIELNEWAQRYFHKFLTEDEKGKLIGLSYFTERGLTLETINTFGLGFCPDTGAQMTEAALAKGWSVADLVKIGLTVARENWKTDRFRGRVIFPIHSISGRAIAFGGRALRTDERTAKYVNSPESPIYHKSNELFGLSMSRKGIAKRDKCLLVEGYMDVLSMWQRGVDYIVASSGTALTVEQVRLIHRFAQNITVLYDGDSAGIKAAERGAGLLLEEGLAVRIVLLPDGQDPDDFAKTHSLEEIEAYIAEHEQDFIQFITSLALDEAKNDPNSLTRLAESVLAKVALVPNPLTRSMYIRQTSELFKLSEQLLTDAVNDLRTKRGITLQREAARDLRRAQDPPSEAQEEPSSDIPPASDTEQRLDASEREIVEFLLRYGREDPWTCFDLESGEELLGSTIAEFFFKQLDVDEITFENPTYRDLLAEYREVYTSNPDVDLQEHFTLHPSPDYAKLAVELTVDKFTLSRRWQRDLSPKMIETSHYAYLSLAAERIIYTYKARVIMLRLRALEQQLAQTEDEALQLELLRAIQEQNYHRHRLAELLRRTQL
ncbi:MAG: DNA primase [Bacteroides sp.]